MDFSKVDKRVHTSFSAVNKIQCGVLSKSQIGK